MKLTIGSKAPEIVNVFIEIPSGSSIKYELDKDTGVIMVDRFLYTSFSYPFNYGFVPETLAEDGDPVDVLVLTDRQVQAGIAIPSVVIGMLEMEDEEGIDTKIIAVPTSKIDPIFGAYTEIDSLPELTKNRIKHFFEHYKDLEPNKWVKVKSWKNKQAAATAITEGMKRYQK